MGKGVPQNLFLEMAQSRAASSLGIWNKRKNEMQEQQQLNFENFENRLKKNRKKKWQDWDSAG